MYRFLRCKKTYYKNYILLSTSSSWLYIKFLIFLSFFLGRMQQKTKSNQWLCVSTISLVGQTMVLQIMAVSTQLWTLYSSQVLLVKKGQVPLLFTAGDNCYWKTISAKVLEVSITFLKYWKIISAKILGVSVTFFKSSCWWCGKWLCPKRGSKLKPKQMVVRGVIGDDRWPVTSFYWNFWC